MSLKDFKFIESIFAGKQIADLSDTPSSDGMTAEKLKEYFDFIPKTMIAMGAINGIIDLLTSTAGAVNIGANVSGVTGTEVQSILESIKALLDERYTKEAADILLEAKADRVTVAKMVKSIEFDHGTGTFTITEQGGDVHTIDTAVEKIAVNFRFDANEEALIMTLPDGSEEKVSLSAFVDNNDITESNTIAVLSTGGKVILSIKDGSITDSMLSSTLITAIQGYAQACSDAVASASANAKNAGIYADNAAESASTARASETNAKTSENNAKESENITKSSQAEAANSARLAAQHAQEAKNYRDEAQQFAGGDFVTSTEFAESIESLKPAYTEYTMLASGWTENAYSFENVYPSETYDIEISLSSSATQEMVDAFNGATITGSVDTNVLTAFGDIPTIDILVIVKVVKK